MLKVPAGDVTALISAVRRAPPGATVYLDDGLYSLPRDRTLQINTPSLTLRGRSGQRSHVIIRGGANNVTVNASGFTLADVTLENAGYHSIQIRGEDGVASTRVYNVHMRDSGQQFVKVSAGDGLAGKFADGGEIACSLIEYTRHSVPAGGQPASYTNAIDILAGEKWVIRDNVIRRIRSEEGPAGPAILVWRNSIGTVVSRNLIVDSWRGIALGLNAPNFRSRGGEGVTYDHQDGVVEGNVFLALRERADAAIENHYALNSTVVHNTVYYNEGLDHAVGWGIEYRFPPTTVRIENNLSNRAILRRRPWPEQEAALAGNITSARPEWFRDIMSEDYRLAVGAPPVDAGAPSRRVSHDRDGDLRPQGTAPDVGADELPTKP